MHWLAIVVLTILASCGLFVIARVWRLSALKYSFRTMLRNLDSESPASNEWRRGFACYGSMHMAWYSLVRFSVKPDLVFSRTELQLGTNPVHDPVLGTTVVELQNGEERYELMLSTGDYNGLLSWLGSVPPRESAKY